MDLNIIKKEKIQKIFDFLDFDLEEVKGRVIFFLLFSAIAAGCGYLGDIAYKAELIGLATTLWCITGVAWFGSWIVPVVTYLDK